MNLNEKQIARHVNTSTGAYSRCKLCGVWVDNAGEKCPECRLAEQCNAEVEDALGEAAMRQKFPHGHPAFLTITLDELQLHNNKNFDYASGGSPLGNFERVAAILAMYPKLNLGDRKVVALCYALKQLDAVLWGLNSNIEHKVEGLEGRLQDISVYSKIVQCMVRDERKYTP